jgi:DNA-binding NarL/FixJ family response regulator
VLLAQREEAVLRLLVRGLRYKEIAAEFNSSVEIVHTHIRHIHKKLHVTSLTEAVVKYLGRAPSRQGGGETERDRLGLLVGTKTSHRAEAG